MVPIATGNVRRPGFTDSRPALFHTPQMNAATTPPQMARKANNDVSEAA
jgi:hypothetical protein